VSDLAKPTIIRDRAYLDHLHGERCVLTGQLGTQSETIDPMHIGGGMGSKRSDDEVLPVLHRFHQLGHQSGEISMLRQFAPDWLLRAAFRAYARQIYQEYLAWKRKLAG
jgi:hypothetical protein